MGIVHKYYTKYKVYIFNLQFSVLNGFGVT